MSEGQNSGVKAVAKALAAQMDAQTDADCMVPSSIQRGKGLVWLEGWFDLAAAMPAASEGEVEWDSSLTDEEKGMIDQAWERHKAAAPNCDIPPVGWKCSRTAGHDGPCAATPAPSDQEKLDYPAIFSEIREQGLRDLVRELVEALERTQGSLCKAYCSWAKYGDHPLEHFEDCAKLTALITRVRQTTPAVSEEG